MANYVISDGALIRKFLPSSGALPVSGTPTEDRRKPGISLFEDVLCEGFNRLGDDDEVQTFIRATASASREVSPLVWWSAHAQKYPQLAELA